MEDGHQDLSPQIAEEWNQAKQSLKYENRYFNERIKGALSTIFEGIEKCVELDSQSAILEIAPDNPNYSIFRARCFDSKEKAENALENSEKQFGAPPPEVSTAGRMNAVGIPVFYGATSQRLAVSETRPPIGCHVVVAQFKIIDTIRLLDIECLSSTIRDILSSIEESDDLIKLSDFLSEFNEEMTQIISPENESIQYIVTQVISEYASLYTNLEIHGLIYDSSQASKISKTIKNGDKIEKNIAIFNKFSSIRSDRTSAEENNSQTPMLRLHDDTPIVYAITGADFSTDPKLNDTD